MIEPECTDACAAAPRCTRCGQVKSPRGRSVAMEMAIGMCGVDCPGYAEEPRAGHLWPGELAQWRELQKNRRESQSPPDPVSHDLASRAVELALDAALGEVSRQGGGSPQIFKEARGQGIFAATVLLAGAERERARAQAHDEILTCNVDTVVWSVRVENAFLNAGITTFGELVTKTENDLRKLKNFGKTSLREVRDRLASLGLQLAGSQSPLPSRRSCEMRGTSPCCAAKVVAVQGRFVLEEDAQGRREWVPIRVFLCAACRRQMLGREYEGWMADT